MDEIGFLLKKIQTVQFAMLDYDDVSIANELRFGTQVKFGLESQNKALIVLAKFQFQQNEKTFLILEIACHFKVSDIAWNKFINEKSESITVPMNFIKHLVMITIGTARGILHEKTNNTKFNEFILPTVNVNDLIEEDVNLKFTDFISEPV